tara:strand:- start:318 stop:1673 length:1356 start_codon:yes stop_codon:yes gene_type:complete
MAKRDILKEAIADAKAVKETAIANAKAALEEAFTPQLKSMLAAKLEEMELEEEKEPVDEMGYGNYEEDEKGMEEGHTPDHKKEMEEGHTPDHKKEMEEGHGGMYDEDSMEEGHMMGMKPMYDEDSSMEEDLNLDEILAELESELNEEKDEGMKKEEISEVEHEDPKMDSEEEEMEMDSESEEIDLEDMTDDDLKEFIEDVITDMVKSGELEAGDNFEDEDTEEEVSMEVEDSEEIMEGKNDEMDEAQGSNIGGGSPDFAAIGKEIAALIRAAKEVPGAVKNKIMDLKKSYDDYMKDPKNFPPKYDPKFTRPEKFREQIESLKEEVNLVLELQESQAKVEKLEAAIDVKDKALNEVNLLNAKLLYTNKIFRAKTLTESQKVKVLGAFDKANTVKETKLVFETLNEGLKTKKTTIKESLGSASKSTGNFKTNKKPIVETDPMVARFQKLAGIK